MKKAICIILCVSAVLAFASCKKGGEDVSTTAPSQSAVQEQTSSTAAPVQSSASSEEKTTQAEKAGEKTTEKSAEKTTAQSTRENEATPVTVNRALDWLEEFYGGAYNVNATIKEGNIQYFKITDKQGNLYARVEVNLKTSHGKEKVSHSGEENEFIIEN